MGFKRHSDFSNIEKVLNENKKRKTSVDESIDYTQGIIVPPSEQKVKKVKERMKPFNFTMKPSVREKLKMLVAYDTEYEADSASSYLSEFIEKRFSDLNLNDEY